MAKRNIDISNPFILYEWVNYWINDQEEYEEIMALSLDDEMALRSLNSESTGNSGSEEGSEVGSDEETVENDENFIDRRNVIPNANGDYDNLAPEDNIEFKNQVKE